MDRIITNKGGTASAKPKEILYNPVNPVSKTNDDLTGQIIGLAMKVHRTLGPDFLESLYQKALLYELVKVVCTPKIGPWVMRVAGGAKRRQEH